MDFTAEEELRQQAHEVWLHYACPACDATRSSPPPRLLAPMEPSDCDGPCSVLPFFFGSSESLDALGNQSRPRRQ